MMESKEQGKARETARTPDHKTCETAREDVDIQLVSVTTASLKT
jgi:hypothetical protein